MDYIVDQAAGVRPQRTAERADHACRHRRLKSVRAAERDYKLSHTKLLRIAECSGCKAGFVYTRLLEADHCEVACRIISNCGRGHAPAIRQSYVDSARAYRDNLRRLDG